MGRQRQGSLSFDECAARVSAQFPDLDAADAVSSDAISLPKSGFVPLPATPAAKSQTGSPSSTAHHRWTRKEHGRFEASVRKHGTQWEVVARSLGRSVEQVRAHARKLVQLRGAARRRGGAPPRRQRSTYLMNTTAGASNTYTMPQSVTLQVEAKSAPVGIVPLLGSQMVLSDVRRYAERLFPELRAFAFAFVDRKGASLPPAQEYVTPAMTFIATREMVHHTFGDVVSHHSLRLRIIQLPPTEPRISPIDAPSKRARSGANPPDLVLPKRRRRLRSAARRTRRRQAALRSTPQDDGGVSSGFVRV